MMSFVAIEQHLPFIGLNGSFDVGGVLIFVDHTNFLVMVETIWAKNPMPFPKHSWRLPSNHLQLKFKNKSSII
jgi:hypothetical protein